MTARYRYLGMEYIPATQDSNSWDLVPMEPMMPKGNNKSSNKYSEETDTHHPSAELLEQFWQLKDQFSSLKSAIHPPTPMAELTQLTDKLPHLTKMFQLHPVPQPIEEPIHKTMQAYTDTLHTTQREANLTMTMLQDIPTFDGQDSSKLEYWFIDREISTDILTESHTQLAESKSTHSSMRPFKQENSGMKSRTSFN